MSLNILQASERSYKSSDQKPKFLIGYVPYPCDHCVRECHHAFVLATLRSPSSPAAWASLTPGPSPTLRERGDLVRERGIVDSRRIAPAPFIPLRSHQAGAEGGQRGR